MTNPGFDGPSINDLAKAAQAERAGKAAAWDAELQQADAKEQYARDLLRRFAQWARENEVPFNYEVVGYALVTIGRVFKKQNHVKQTTGYWRLWDGYSSYDSYNEASHDVIYWQVLVDKNGKIAVQEEARFLNDIRYTKGIEKLRSQIVKMVEMQGIAWPWND